MPLKSIFLEINCSLLLNSGNCPEKSKRRRGVDFPFAFLYNNYGLASPYKMPCAIIAFATFMNPATLAPFT